jgi:DNA-binding transcriptional regulator YiaG
MRVTAKKSISKEQFSTLSNDIGFSVMDVARLAGVGEATAQRWSDGRSRVPHSVATLLKLMTKRPELAPVIEECAQ